MTSPDDRAPRRGDGAASGASDGLEGGAAGAASWYGGEGGDGERASLGSGKRLPSSPSRRAVSSVSRAHARVLCWCGVGGRFACGYVTTSDAPLGCADWRVCCRHLLVPACLTHDHNEWYGRMDTGLEGRSHSTSGGWSSSARRPHPPPPHPPPPVPQPGGQPDLPLVLSLLFGWMDGWVVGGQLFCPW